MSQIKPEVMEQLAAPLRSELLSEKITDRVLQLIRQERLKPGDRLPPERELAAMMGVSRASIREAMRSLATMNVVEMRQGSGTYITSLEPDLMVEHLDLVFLLNDATFLNLIETRKVIETATASFAAQRRTESELNELTEIMELSRQCLERDPIAEFPELDIRFHAKIADCSHNPLLSRFMQAITRLGIAGSQRTASTSQVKGIKNALAGHELIFEAISQRDSAAAGAAMLNHLQAVEQRFQELLSDNLDSSDKMLT